MTALIYVLITVGVAALLFALSTVVFGRGEPLPQIGAERTLTILPEDRLTGDDLESVTFAMAARGYRMDEVDWTLARVAREIDSLRDELARMQGTQQSESGPDSSPNRGENEPDQSAPPTTNRSSG